MIRDLNRYLRGWHGYFKHIELPYKYPFDTLDRFLRRRVRSAIVGRTGTGWWNSTITNAMLMKLGLEWPGYLQMLYRQVKLGPPARKG